MNLAGICRPPSTKHPLYQAPLEKTSADIEETNITSIIPGDLNVTKWGRDLYESAWKQMNYGRFLTHWIHWVQPQGHGAGFRAFVVWIASSRGAAAHVCSKEGRDGSGGMLSIIRSGGADSGGEYGAIPLFSGALATGQGGRHLILHQKSND